MKSLFDTAADLLTPDLQSIRELLWARWDDCELKKELWLKHIEIASGEVACESTPKAAFLKFVDAGVLVAAGDKFKLDKDA